MKTKYISFSTALLGILVGVAPIASVSAAELDTIAVAEAVVGPALNETVRRSQRSNELSRVTQAMDGQLIDALHRTRKFTVIARSDLTSIFREQDFSASGNVDLNSSGAAQRFQVAGVKYLVVPGVDDFLDLRESFESAAMGTKLNRREVQISGVARVYNTTTGVLLETVSYGVKKSTVEELGTNVTTRGELSDALLMQVAQDVGKTIAARVEDVIYPARVLARTGNQVTFNRGDGSLAEVDQVWEVFARGEELIDPDTGMSLGVNEVPVGSVKVNAVRPQFSTAVVVEDFGIETGAILRLPVNKN